MFMGHYAVALAIHAKQPALPLWAWIGAVQATDLLWAVLVMTGIKKNTNGQLIGKRACGYVFYSLQSWLAYGTVDVAFWGIAMPMVI